MAPPDSRLCPGCRIALDQALRRLPARYDACERSLGTAGRPTPWLQVSGRLSGNPGMPFNAGAADCRSAILGVLASWADLTVAERKVAAPRRTVAGLSGFLRRQLDWLARHPAVGELSAEVLGVERSAARISGTAGVRRLPIGPCVEPGCDGSLIARVAPDRHRRAEIRCDTEPDHTWSGQDWLALRRRMRGSSATSASNTGRPSWLSPSDVACLWDIPHGSVYRLASERQWRRQKRRGRTFYAEADVQLTMRQRATA